jgi:hypothetical protein
MDHKGTLCISCCLGYRNIFVKHEEETHSFSLRPIKSFALKYNLNQSLLPFLPAALIYDNQCRGFFYTVMLFVLTSLQELGLLNFILTQ